MKNNLYHNILFLLVLTLISLPLHLEAENKLTQVDSLLNQIYIECETENTLNLSLSDFKKHFKYIQSEQVYAYDSISGPISLVLDQESDFFFLKNTDSTFHYSVGGLEKKGQWDLKLDTLYEADLITDIAFVLQLQYVDTVRAFQILDLTRTSFSLAEGDLKFFFKKKHLLPDNVEIISFLINDYFEPVVAKMGSVIFWDISLGYYSVFSKNKLAQQYLLEKDPINKLTLYKAIKKEIKKPTSLPFIVLWLVFGAIFFTFKMNFINVKGFRHAIELVRGDYSNPDHKGEVSHFQALTTALSGTVGLGNIAGVAIAISLGGAGATFWMVIAGLLGMSSKFVECTLGLKYRQIDKYGAVSGGPMYYLKAGLAKKKLPGLGKFLAVLFAILCVGGSIGGGNMFQANQAFEAVSGTFPSLSNMGPIFGIILALLVGFVIIGGIKSIAWVTEKIVPFMAVIYVGVAVLIIGMNFDSLDWAIQEIIMGALTPQAGLGGLVGVLIVGFKRAAFSNEAGVGSASIAHSAAKTKEPVSEGMVALLEPFIDTVVICTMTALVIILTGSVDNIDGLSGTALTSQAFGSVIPWFPWVLTIAVLLFAFSTMISWSYYGLKSWTFLFGKNKRSELIYKIIFMIFVVIGSSASLGAVVDFSDMMILAMAFPNIIGLLILSGEVKKDMQSYFKKLTDGTIKKYK